MPMRYLLELSQDELPLIESDVENIDTLRVLHAAGLVEVRFLSVDADVQTAQVLFITGLGAATLRACGGATAHVPPAVLSASESECDLEPSFD